MPKNPLGKPTAFDYLVMFGGPALFFLIAVLGIYWVIGPGPPPNPVKLIKDGAVKVGMGPAEVQKAVGLPKEIKVNDDGGVTWRYQHGTAEPYVEEDAYVDFGPSGRVINVTIERVNAIRPAEQLK